MKLLKSEKQRTEKASMIYNWLRTPPRHICEFRYGSPCLRQEKRQAHIPAVSPQTRQDTKGTCQSQAGTWSPFMHGTLLNPVPQWVCWAVMEPCPALLGGPQTAKTCALGKTYSSAPHCCSAWILSIDYWVQILFFFYSILFSKFSSSQKSHKIWRCGLKKEMILPITYAMVSPEPHRAPTTTVMTADTRICSRNGLR